MRLLICLAFFAFASVLNAQGSRTVAPGMSRAKVVAALGKPSTERTVGEFQYLFYANACGKQCGMNDLVVLKNDSVVDAIFRSSTRHYAGTSSSPAPISAKDAADRAPTSGAPAKASNGTIRMKPPTKPNDATPSIPLDRPTLGPAPTTTQPATRTP